MAQESARKSGHHRHSRDIRPRLRLLFIAMDDPIIQCVERFCCPRGALFAERRNRGYTLYDASSGAPVARLRPTGHQNKFEILYCSLWKQRWTSTGPFGRTVLSINDALQFIAYQDIFWAMTRSVQNPKLRKVELSAYGALPWTRKGQRPWNPFIRCRGHSYVGLTVVGDPRPT